MTQPRKFSHLSKPGYVYSDITTTEMLARKFQGIYTPFERTSDLLIGIPVLNRPDLLDAAVGSLRDYGDLVIVDNAAKYPEVRSSIAETADRHGAIVMPQDFNIGVAASWNVILKAAVDLGYKYILITANDTEHPPEILESSLGQFILHSSAKIGYVHAHNSFLLKPEIIDLVGYFDENFYPAYCEDVDYSYRINLVDPAMHAIVSVSGKEVIHHGSMTVRSDGDFANCNSYTHGNWNMNHFICKWGVPLCDLGGWSHPYNNAAYDARFWPDPDGSIQHRNWDRMLGR